MSSHLPDHIRQANRERVGRWHGPDDDWTLGDWGNATAGEMGELCNIVKKIRRRQSMGTAVAYNTPEMEELRAKYAEERADVLIYLDLMDKMVNDAIGGLDDDFLERGIVDKFNKVSEAQGWDDLTVATGSGPYTHTVVPQRGGPWMEVWEEEVT